MLGELIGSNYLLANAADIFWNDDDIVEDMLKEIRADEERLFNWIECTEKEIITIHSMINERVANYYSMNDPHNPYNVEEPEIRVWNICQRIWKELHND